MSVMDYLQGVASHYGNAKRAVEAWTGAGQEMLHVHAGLLIFVLASLLLRKKFRSPIPLGLVVVFAVLNELIDWVNSPSPNALEPYLDIANTAFWPCVLFLLARRRH